MVMGTVKCTEKIAWLVPESALMLSIVFIFHARCRRSACMVSLAL